MEDDDYDDALDAVDVVEDSDNEQAVSKLSQTYTCCGAKREGGINSFTGDIESWVLGGQNSPSTSRRRGAAGC